MPDFRFLPVYVALLLFVLEAVSCRPVARLNAGISRDRKQGLRFINGDSAFGKVAFLMPIRPARPEIALNGRPFAPDTLSGFTLASGRYFKVLGARIYQQTVAGRIDGYRRIARYSQESDSFRNAGSTSVTLLQKAPDREFYRPLDNVLARMVKDDPVSLNLALQHRKAWRSAQLSLGAGIALVAVGAAGLLAGAAVSDLDAAGRRPYFLAGAAGIAAGGLSLGIPFAIFNNHSRHYRNAALNRYNAR